MAQAPERCPPPSASTITLFLNFLSSLAWFCVDPSAGSGFGLSILWALLYTPCSFVCWYRPMYKAFRCVPEPWGPLALRDVAVPP